MQPITQPQSQKFQVALSFAGEDRAFSEAVAKGLKRNGISVFYDNDCQGELWGADLPVKLREIYNKESQYCMLFLSDHYKKKMWTNYERQQALEKAISTFGSEYVLPIRVDGYEGEIPGLSNHIGYVNAASNDPEKIVNLFLEKLGVKENNEETEVNKEKEWVLVLSGKVSDVDKTKAEAIIKHLQSIVSDSDLTLVRIEEGSIRLVVKGSNHGLLAALALFKKGLLQDIDGYKVLSVDNNSEKIKTRELNVSGKNIKTDRDGYIVNLNEWVPGFAEITAHEDELELTDEHWEVINFLREYYEEYQIPPAVSFLTKAIDKKLSEKANDKNGLFPKGGVEQALKLAGIPKKELIKHSNK